MKLNLYQATEQDALIIREFIDAYMALPEQQIDDNILFRTHGMYRGDKTELCHDCNHYVVTPHFNIVVSQTGREIRTFAGLMAHALTEHKQRVFCGEYGEKDSIKRIEQVRTELLGELGKIYGHSIEQIIPFI